MKRFFKKNIKWIGYTLYGILLTGALLFYLFPSDLLKAYIKATVETKNSNLLITFKKAALSFPLGIKFTAAECHIQRDPERPVFAADEILIRPRLWSFISGNPEYRFTCQAYDGVITGRIIVQKSNKERIFDSSVEFHNIHIDDKSPLPLFIKDYLAGVLEGNIIYKGNDIYDAKGAGEASLTLNKGSIKLAKPILNISMFNFKEILLKADLKEQNLNISNIELKGDSFLGQASGVINLKNTIKKSNINLKGTIEPTAAFIQDSAKSNNPLALLKQSLKKGKLSFSLQGNFEKTIFSLL
jgi:type II secretion system protein N